MGYYFNKKFQEWQDNSVFRKNKINQQIEDSSYPNDGESGSGQNNIEPRPSATPDSNSQPSSQPYNSDPTPYQGNANDGSSSQPTYNDNSQVDSQGNSGSAPVEPPAQEPISPSTLVSCQTQIQHCEPKDSQQYENPSTNTFCITYASNCITPESIQRTWKEEEVFKPVEQPVETPDTPIYEPEQYDNMNQDYQNQQQQYPGEPVPQPQGLDYQNQDQGDYNNY